MRLFIPLLLLVLWMQRSMAMDTLAREGDTAVKSCYCAIPLAPTTTFDSKHTYYSLSPLMTETYTANSLQLDIDFHSNSNAIPTTFAGAFLSGGTITDEIKNRCLSYTTGAIKYEDELKAGIAYKHYFGSSGFGLYASYYHRNIRTLYTTHDAFKLMFYGNKPFEGTTADLSDIRFENLMYNQYAIGVSKALGHFFVGLNISFLQGFSNLQVNNTRGSLYTAPFGEYLDMSYNLVINQSNVNSTKFFDLNGSGFAADLQLVYHNAKSRFSFTVSDLGSIAWNKNTANYTGDTSFRYEGINVGDITNLTGNGLRGINLDSIAALLGPKKSNRAYTTTLPTTFQVTYAHLFQLRKSSMILTFGINTRLLHNYYAYGYIKTSFLLRHDWTTAVSIGAGGYSLCNVGIDVGKTWRNFDFIIGTANLVGSILPMYYPGSSAYLRLGFHFADIHHAAPIAR